MNLSFKHSLAKKTQPIGFFFWICLSMVSCIEVIEVPDDFYTDNIILNSIIDPDSTVMINISRSLPPAGVIEFEFVNDADVRISEAENEQEVVCQYLENGWYTSSDLVLEAERDYEINVIVADKKLSTTTSIPEKPMVENVHIQYDSIYFSIVDDPNITQYYLITLMGYLLQSDRIQLPNGTYDYVFGYKYKPVNLQSEDASIDAYLNGRVGHVNNATGFTFTDSFYDLVPDHTGDSFLISDQTFQGETKEFLMNITKRGLWFIDSIRTVDLQVHSIDFNYYQYLLTFAQYWTTDETPFTERAKVYNNIEEGFGIFGSKNGVSRELILSDKLIEDNLEQ
jgi:hypothetical protein